LHLAVRVYDRVRPNVAEPALIKTSGEYARSPMSARLARTLLVLKSKVLKALFM
jgi:hypothetical protein